MRIEWMTHEKHPAEKCGFRVRHPHIPFRHTPPSASDEFSRSVGPSLSNVEDFVCFRTRFTLHGTTGITATIITLVLPTHITSAVHYIGNSTVKPPMGAVGVDALLFLSLPLRLKVVVVVIGGALSFSRNLTN
uniref:Transmembrane protein n=1 Tax=Romanomermis culicivorax TaxID=13658 RepID=A0A915IHA3_ROMCU